MTDRILSISVPEDRSAKLENLLLDHFYDNIITGLKRQVGGDRSSQRQKNKQKGSTSKNIYNENEEKKENNDDNISCTSSDGDELSITKGEIEHNEGIGREGQIEVTAWQVLELLPFYSGMNEQGNAIETQAPQNFPDWHLMLPIVLNRYRYDQRGNSHKINTIIDIPPQIEFNRFVNRNTDYPICGTCGRRVECVMRLQSAVCHKGNSVHAGHYIAYAKSSNSINNNSNNNNHKHNHNTADHQDNDTIDDEDNEIWLKFGNFYNQKKYLFVYLVVL